MEKATPQKNILSRIIETYNNVDKKFGELIKDELFGPPLLLVSAPFMIAIGCVGLVLVIFAYASMMSVFTVYAAVLRPTYYLYKYLISIPALVIERL